LCNQQLQPNHETKEEGKEIKDESKKNEAAQRSRFDCKTKGNKS